MNILFLENRYKTYTFEAIANLLKKDGHKISFLIQNKHYKPKSEFNYFEIPFPKKDDLKKVYKIKKDVEDVIDSDRMQNFFKKKEPITFIIITRKYQKF